MACRSRAVAKRHFSFLLQVSGEGVVVQSRVGQGWRSEHPVWINSAVQRCGGGLSSTRGIDMVVMTSIR